MRAMLAIDRYLGSCLVILSSLWAAWVLATPPSNFAAFPVAFKYALAVEISENAWAILAGAGAGIHMIGLVLRWRGRDIGAARLVGFIGLSLQTIFWLYLGLTAIVANPDTLFGFTAAMMGVAAAWRLGRYGWSPDV